MALEWQKFVTEPEPGTIEFTLKAEHVKLLRNAQIMWQDIDYGAPAINPVRPYGSTKLYQSIGETLEEEYPYGESSTTKEAFIDRLEQLHQETAVALQVILATGKFKLTTYRASKFQQNWREYNPNGRKSRKHEAQAESEASE